MPKVLQKSENTQNEGFNVNMNEGVKVTLLVKLSLNTKIREAIIVIGMIMMKYQH